MVNQKFELKDKSSESLAETRDQQQQPPYEAPPCTVRLTESPSTIRNPPDDVSADIELSGVEPAPADSNETQLCCLPPLFASLFTPLPAVIYISCFALITLIV